MNIKVTTKGAEGLMKRFKEQPEQLHRSIESVLKQEARALAVEYGSATMPGPGFSEAKAKKFQARVRNDVGRVFADRSRPGSIFGLLNRSDPAKAAAYWWGGVKKENKKVQERMIRQVNPPRGISVDQLKTARSDRFARVPKQHQPISLATPPQVRALARKQAELVGFAKAGWYVAAKAIGGRVRRNLRDEATGQRSTEEKFPAYVRKLARKFPGIGGANYGRRGDVHTVAVWTNVKHAENALNEGMRASAESRAQESFIKAMLKAIQSMNRRPSPASTKAA